uniref:Uncharacterized protein n=1 Tax=Neobodo designis TaxID=312471 RepID=A0A7S1LDR9_NEODS|mmetsp:Transcript_18926/g.58754  ORF Transcript_18926/g.58754 Transcript_18926/m.58754 type:complete len:1160 (+) Transcript_18926:382-3861(+)
MAESQPRFNPAEPPNMPGAAAGRGGGSFQSIRQLMSARREFHKRVSQSRADGFSDPKKPSAMPKDSVDPNAPDGNPSTAPLSPLASTAEAGPLDDQRLAQAAGVVGHTFVPIEFADDGAVEPSTQHDDSVAADEGAAESLCVWKVVLYLRDELATPDPSPTTPPPPQQERQTSPQPQSPQAPQPAAAGAAKPAANNNNNNPQVPRPASANNAPFHERYGLPPPSRRPEGAPPPVVKVHVVIKFNASNPDVEAPMIRIRAPRIAGPSLFHGVVCAADLANGQWQLRNTYDVLLALRDHLIQHCGIEAAGAGRAGGGKFSDVEASDGATYIASLHPDWKLQADATPQDMSRVRELVEAAASTSNQAAYLAQELQQREVQLTRQIALQRRPLLEKPPALVQDTVLRDEETESMIRHLRELALQRLDEAASIIETGETLQRRACALFALGRYTDAYELFKLVQRRYQQAGGMTSSSEEEDADASDADDEAETSDDAGHHHRHHHHNGDTPSKKAKSKGKKSQASDDADEDRAAVDVASPVAYELAHCSLKLNKPRRAFHEALLGIRHSPPGPFASVLHAIATAVAKEELDGVRQAVLHAHVTTLSHQRYQQVHGQGTTDAAAAYAAATHKVGSRAKEAFTVLQQLHELSPHNPQVLGAMAYTLAVGGDHAQAQHCLDVANAAAGLDPIAMAILDPPPLTQAMQRVWTEHRAMIADWLPTVTLIAQLETNAAVRRVSQGLPPDPTADEEFERRNRILRTPPPSDDSSSGSYPLSNPSVDEQQAQQLQQQQQQQMNAFAHPAVDPEERIRRDIAASEVGMVRALRGAVRIAFTALDAAALVPGAGACEFGEAMLLLQLTGFLGHYGPPPPYGSVIDLAQFHHSKLDHLIAGRRTVLPQHLDSLLDLKTVISLRGEFLGPALALELRQRAWTDFVPFMPQVRYDSAEFRRLIAMTPAASRQQYYHHVRELVLTRTVDALMPTFRSIATDRLALERLRRVWSLTEHGGDISMASEIMERGMRDLHRTRRREEDLSLDGPRWFRRRGTQEHGLSAHRLKPSRKELEPHYDMDVMILVATREANGGDISTARSIVERAAVRLATAGPHRTCPRDMPCTRCRARAAAKAFLLRLDKWEVPSESSYAAAHEATTDDTNSGHNSDDKRGALP